MSDSSSEDEIPHHLLESVDKEFLNDSMFSKSTNSNKGNICETLKTPPSLRPKSDENDIFTSNGISKSNQSFIAKKLSKLLDQKLEKVISQDCSDKYDCDKSVDGGVQLFSNSSEYLSESNHVMTESCDVINRKRKSNIKITEKELKSRCKSVAVSPEWIFSGAATKGWAKTTKGEVIHLKKLKTNDKDVIECEVIK